MPLLISDLLPSVNAVSRINPLILFYPVGASTLYHQTHYVKIQSKLQILEEKMKEAERTAELAEADAREKDKELVEALKRLKDYESVCIFILSIKDLRG